MQQHCHQCGKRLLDSQPVVQRVLRTGTRSGGSGHYRRVNLCEGCSTGLFAEARSARIFKVLAVLGVVVALVAGGVYYYFFKMQL